MDFQNKLFTYPVLKEENDDYLNSSFSVEISTEIKPRQIDLTFHFNLIDSQLQNLINNNLAEFVIHIESPKVSFRQIKVSNLPDIKTSIKSDLIKEKIEISTLLVAKKNISNYSNENFNSIYSGIEFNIKRGNILAIGDSIEVKINKSEDDIENFPSIFSICRISDDLEIGISYNIDSSKIEIGLNDNNFSLYNTLSQNPRLNNSMLSMLIIPALQYVFSQLELNGISEYEENRWFKVLFRSLKKLGLELNDDLLKDKEPYYLAHILLKNPLERSMEAIIDFNDEDDE